MTTPVPTKQPASLRKKLGWAAAILIGLPVLWTAVFWQEITVYREFKRLCATDAGLKVFEKLEPGKIWRVDTLSSAQPRRWPTQVLAFRTTDEKGRLVDVRPTGKPQTGVYPDYSIDIADQTQEPLYVQTFVGEYLDKHRKLSKTTYQILDANSHRVLIHEIWYDFRSSNIELIGSLSPFDYAWVTATCPARGQPQRIRSEFETFFK